MSIGLAVFGAGRMGATHVRNAALHVPGAHLVGIGDVDRQAAQRLIDEVGVGRADDADALLKDPHVEAVIIATPHQSDHLVMFRNPGPAMMPSLIIHGASRR